MEESETLLDRHPWIPQVPSISAQQTTIPRHPPMEGVFSAVRSVVAFVSRRRGVSARCDASCRPLASGGATRLPGLEECTAGIAHHYVASWRKKWWAVPSLRVFSFVSGGMPLLLISVFLAAPASAMDQVTYRHNGKTSEVTGRVLIAAQDGGLLVEGCDGVLTIVSPEEKISHTTDARPFAPYSRDELKKRILAELPKGFRDYSTKHYLILSDTSPEYAKWCGSLFEDLYKAFANMWTRQRFELSEPEFPLVAVVFADMQEYQRFSRPELGEGAEGVIGYYSLASNRMTMFDLTGVESQGHGRMGTTAQINQILAQPEAARTISTIVHEATHQIAFNSGLHTRLSDCPRWFSEGIAMYFETPDLRNGIKKGWSGMGGLNKSRLLLFHAYLPNRAPHSIETLIRDDRRFLDTKQALNAYAEAWALTYFLMRQRPKEYVAYLRTLSAKKPMVEDKPEERLNDFRQAFGDLGKLETDFIRYMAKLR